MLKTLVALYSGALNNVSLMPEKMDTQGGSDMSNYTLHISRDQKDLIVTALEKIASMTMGQSFHEQEHAKKLLGHFTKNKNSTTIDLSKVGVE